MLNGCRLFRDTDLAHRYIEREGNARVISHALQRRLPETALRTLLRQLSFWQFYSRMRWCCVNCQRIEIHRKPTTCIRVLHYTLTARCSINDNLRRQSDSNTPESFVVVLIVERQLVNGRCAVVVSRDVTNTIVSHARATSHLIVRASQPASWSRRTSSRPIVDDVVGDVALLPAITSRDRRRDRARASAPRVGFRREIITRSNRRH